MSNITIDFKADYLDTYCDAIDPKDFYRSIFPLGELQRKGIYTQGKYNAIAIELLSETKQKRNIKRYTITDDLDMLDVLLQRQSFILLSPISYIGKSRRSFNARLIYAIAIDLDGMTKKQHIVDLFYQMDGNGPSNHLPKPTYIVNSGNGLHIYYVLLKPIPCFERNIVQINNLKNELTHKLWNEFVTSLYDNIQYQSIFQGFRLVGGITKKGTRTQAYMVGDKVSIEYLNEFVEEENRVTQFNSKSSKRSKRSLSLSEAKEKYPEWYEKRIVKAEKKAYWTVKRDLYDWWHKKVKSEICEGHRYYGVMCLAIYARKCGLSREELENDAFSLIDHLDRLTSTDDNHFTRADVLSALEAFNDNYITFPIETISELTGIYIQKNRRNYRKQINHLKLIRMIRDFDGKNGEWRNKNGGPRKEKMVKDYLEEHPMATVTEAAKALSVSRTTIYKYKK